MFAYIPLTGFIALFSLSAKLWPLPDWVGGFYLALSTACFAMHAIDKCAASQGKWRVPERTLIGLGLVGGWPGGILAQQLLRHKTAKNSYQRFFWLAVVVNLAAFLAICTPLGHTLKIKIFS